MERKVIPVFNVNLIQFQEGFYLGQPYIHAFCVHAAGEHCNMPWEETQLKNTEVISTYCGAHTLPHVITDIIKIYSVYLCLDECF